MEQVLNGLAVGLPVTLLGMGTVFAILAILWGVLELFRVFFYELPKKRQAGAKAEAAPVAAPAPAPAPAVPAPAAPSQDDDELLAVLAAAVAAAMGGSASSFRISSFRRAERSASVWNRTSISERTGSAL